MVASLNILFRSILTTFPVLIRAKQPFLLANSMVRGKFISTMFPVWIGVAIDTEIRTPVSLMFALRPVQNLEI